MLPANVLKTQSLVQIRFTDLRKVRCRLGNRSQMHFYLAYNQRVNVKHLKNNWFPDETIYVFA